MSHDLCLFASSEEFPLVGNPDADTLGRGKAFCGNEAPIIKWYEQHCRALGWDAIDWEGRAHLDYSWHEYRTKPPEWADPDPVARHIAMINAFLAFAPGASFGAD